MPRSRAHAAQFRQTLALFAIFGHPIRVVMFQRLAKTPMTAGELARTLPVSRTAVVQHLKRMEAARLVVAEAQGKRRLYRMEAQGLAPLRQWLEKHRNKPSTKHPPASTNAGNS
ncbi:MAG TPA: metalloregulator ArsR/SmtB family transcription factor [Rhizomicrobium sp.]|jgi:DNA-binding transcriptional ArsR family regulator|nr:metalloregulator ArsR/SmtB family transcription factor [Rhizomicrobium sp.]